MDGAREFVGTGRHSSRYSRWLNTRFVYIVEVIGYLLSGVVGVAVVYSIFARVEVLAYAAGEVKPPSQALKVASESVVIEFLVKPGDEVDAGTAVCRIVTAPEDRHRVLAERRLASAVEALESGGNGDTAASRDQVRKALADLPPPGPAEPLTCPAAGRVKPMVAADQMDVVPAEQPLAAVYQLDVLEMTGPLEPVNAEKVTAGQTARVTLPGVGGPFQGEVVSVTDGEPKMATLRFGGIPKSSQDALAGMLFASMQPLPSIPVRAEIVAGHQSLFMRLFGKKS